MTDGDTSKFFYDEKGNLLREERTKNGVNYKVNYIYAGGEAIGFTLRGQWKIDLDGAKDQDFPFYYVKDAQGNVRKIVDRMGNCVVKYNYNAWGKETVTPVESTWEFPLELNSDGTVKKFCQASDIAELNRLTYRGYFYNRELGLYYLINRYYDPETGRFISADDAEYLDFQTLYGSNRYIYCLNNPVNYIDPDGTIAITLACLIIGAIVGAVVGFGLMLKKDWEDDGKLFNGSVSFWEYLGGTLIGAAIGGLIGYGAGVAAGLLGGVSMGYGIASTGGSAVLVAGGTVVGEQVLVGAGALALGGLIAFSKHRPVMTNKPPVSWLTQEEGIEAMLDSAMDANKAADRLILDHGFNNKHGAGTDHNAVKKWLDRIIRKIIKKSLK